MVNRIRADYSELETVVSRLAEMLDRLQDFDTRVQSDRFELIENQGWYGLGSNVFADEMNTLTQPALSVSCEALELTRAAILQISGRVDGADLDAARLFSAVDGHARYAGEGAAPSALGRTGQVVLNWLNEMYYSRTDNEYGAYNALDDVKDIGTGLNNATGISPGLKKIANRIDVPGVGGILDWLMGEDRSGEELGIQVTSDFAQFGIEVATGGVVPIVDATVQLGGNADAYAIESNAELLSNGDPRREQAILDDVDRYQRGLNGISVDDRIDGVVRNYLEQSQAIDAYSPVLGQIARSTGVLEVTAVAPEAYTFVRGLGDVALGRTTTAIHVIGGAIDRAEDMSYEVTGWLKQWGL